MAPIPEDPNMAQAWISGTPPDQTIDFYIPRGNTGLMGPQGPIGPSLAVGNIETVTGPAAPGTVGAQGLTGPQGLPGGIILGTQLGTNDLNSFTASGVYRQDAGPSATLARNYPRESTGGVLVVLERVPATSVVQRFYPVIGVAASEGQSSYSRTLQSGVWSPWRVYGARRVDQTAGRAIYQWDDVNSREQLIYGDTGVRNIETGFINGWTAALAKLRRNNNIVTLGIYNLNGSANTNVAQAYVLPLGFRVGGQGGSVGWVVQGGVVQVSAAGTDVFGSNASGTVATGFIHELVWHTNDAWPTTLPGTALGTIPNL